MRKVKETQKKAFFLRIQKNFIYFLKNAHNTENYV